MFPTKIIQGDSLTFTISNSNFLPSENWTLEYRLVGKTNNYTITTTVVDETFEVDEAPATTAAYVIGLYTAYEVFTNSDGTRTTNTSHQVEITVDPTTSSFADQRTHAQIALEAIEAVIEKRASTDQNKYTIGNRSLDRIPLSELKEFRADYREEVLIEQGKKGLGKKILVRFK